MESNQSFVLVLLRWVAIFFDHSWVEIGGKQYDFAICNQIEKSFPPVFSSINLDSKTPSAVAFGIPSNELDEPAKNISALTISEYQKIIPKGHKSMYKIAAELGSAIPNSPRWPPQIPPPVATPNSPRQNARIMLDLS